eukprot:06706.XXX_21436_21633_1 [CDS] Oithona nana genome sequencing.
MYVYLVLYSRNVSFLTILNPTRQRGLSRSPVLSPMHFQCMPPSPCFVLTSYRRFHYYFSLRTQGK